MNGKGFRAELQAPASFPTSFRSDLHVVLIVLTNGVHDGEKLCFKCCFTSTETIRLIRDGEPRTTTSTFTQLLSSLSESFVEVLLYVHIKRKLGA